MSGEERQNVSVFPIDFLWGAATSAYQVEGAVAEDGRGPSIWDLHCQVPGMIPRGETGDHACDHYHRVERDTRLMQALNLRAYRFSVSWPRVLPTGQGTVNTTGLDFYDRLVDRLRDAAIEPVVTLYHWDLPAALQTPLDGWLHRDLPRIFADYAALVFDRLGDRVRFWITINEPWCIVDGGYFSGCHPPGLRNRESGYQAGHNLLRAHAYAAARYRASRHSQGQISFALNMPYSYPVSDSRPDAEAAERAMLDFGGWFADPVHCGDYPAQMRQRLGSLLPRFTAEETRLLEGSTDYIALNYYHADVVRHAPGSGPMEIERADRPDWSHTAMGWPIVPDGLRRLLHWLAGRYPGQPVFITECGACCEDQADDDGLVNDQDRIAYLRDHILAVRAALAEGIDVRGFLVWSLLDNFEWSHGYAKRFGLIRCDFDTHQRTIKASGHWYADFIANGGREQTQRPLPQTQVSEAQV